jgi:putative hemolysin
MQIREQHRSRTARPRLELAMASSATEVAEAQALRYRVFAEELGARLESEGARTDSDRFDDFCEHLTVRDSASGEVVGTYRILSPQRAREAGGRYSDGEFDLTRLDALRDEMVEVGRSCVHPDYRGGAVIALLWSGLADYMKQSGHRYLTGCASLSLADGGRSAAGVYQRLCDNHFSPAEWRVSPRVRLPLESLEANADAPLPPLIRGYLRAGATVCGEPAWDPDFNTADLFMMLSMERLDRRYAERFMAGQPG